MPVTLASVDLQALHTARKSDFFSGRPAEEVLDELREQKCRHGQRAVHIQAPCQNRRHLTLSLGESRETFRIVDVYPDYASERGYILMDRDTMLRYLPDPTPSNLAVFVAPRADAEEVRKKIVEVAAGSHILIFSDRDLRTEAIRIFDRTFAITYALEAVAVFVAVMGIAGALARAGDRPPPRTGAASLPRRIFAARFEN